MPPSTSQQALTNYQSIQSNRRKPQDILRESEERLGIPTATQRQVGLRGAITNTENLIRNVDPSVSGRTSGSLVTDAQKQRLIALEREPLSNQFREQSRALEGETANVSELQRRAMQDAQLSISADDAAENAARGLYDTLYQREQDEIARQERARAASQVPVPTINTGNGGGGGGGTTGAATITQRPDKGFNFTDASGRPISAAQFATIKGQSFRSLLQEMANAGDAGARQALSFVGDDFGYDRGKVNSQALAQLYNALVWGTGRSATYKAPAPSVHDQVVNKARETKSAIARNASTGFVTQPDNATLKAALERARSQY